MNTNSFLLKIVLTWLMCFAFGTLLHAKTVYVDANNASGLQNGASWATAYSNLTTALNASVSGDHVWVAAGEYQPAVGAAFPVKDGVNLYGGFDPQEAPDMQSRDWNVYETTLKANGLKSRVLISGNFSKKTCLDGFSLTNSTDVTLNGSVAYLRKGAHLINCHIFGNVGANGVINLDGGKDASDENAPSLINCLIENNSSVNAAVYINTQGIIRDCVIRNNKATGNGGGVHFNLGGIIENTIIRENQVIGKGGGIYAQFNIGAFTPEQNQVNVSRCTIIRNQAAFGGGIWCDKLVEVDNCLIANNEVTDNGGGVWSSGSNIVNCTIVNNLVLDKTTDNTKGLGGGIYMDGWINGTTLNSGTVLKNSVLWGNSIAKWESLPEYMQVCNRLIVATGESGYRGKISFSAIEGLNNPKVAAQAEGGGCVHLNAANLTGPQFTAPADVVGLGSSIVGPEDIENYIPMSFIKKSVAFSAGADGVHSYRIPAMVTTKQGTLLLVCEARKESWRDKSPTDVAVKRSVDGGQTWSEIQFITAQTGTQAYMDPLPIVDMKTGRIFVFSTRWNSATPATPTNNQAILMISDDDGVTWTKPEDVSSKVVAAGKDKCIAGFGPGSGLQMRSPLYPDRLIVPTRQYDVGTKVSETRTVYSDDHGQTWKCGNASVPTGEQQIAELANSVLTVNLRRGKGRNVGYSNDGGVTWGAITQEPTLTAPTNGCQGSVLANDSVFFYVGPEGGTFIDKNHDDRHNLKIWRSLNNGKTWGQNFSLYANAAGYSCQTFLPDGRLAIVFETGNEKGFINSASRDAGWMRLDVIVIPAEILNGKCWIKPDSN